jgi:hypothetical protein
MPGKRVSVCAFAEVLTIVSVALAVCALTSCRPSEQPVQTGPAPAVQPVEKVEPTKPKTSTEMVAVGPHWSSDTCGLCHAETEHPEPISSARTDEICLGCHDGEQAPAERHPMGRTFAVEQVVAPAGWPLVDGRLGCLTCHDARLACDQRTPAIQRFNPDMLRDYEGSLVTWCAECHVQTTEHHKYNPHVMTTADGRVDRSVCLHCHEVDFSDRTETTRTGNARLRSSADLICLGCHTRHVDYFEPGHLGLIQPVRMRSTPLPLGPQHQIACYTCHNPHAEGVFPSDSVLGRGGIRTDAEDKGLRLRGFGKDICHACHY